MAAEDAERPPARRVSGGAMYDPARDAWADRDDNAWPQRSLDHQHQHQQNQPSSPAAAEARPASPANVVPGPVSFPLLLFMYCPAWMVRVVSCCCGYSGLLPLPGSDFPRWRIGQKRLIAFFCY